MQRLLLPHWPTPIVVLISVACSGLGPSDSGNEADDKKDEAGSDSDATEADGVADGNGDDAPDGGDGDVNPGSGGLGTGDGDGDGDGDSAACVPATDRCDCVVRADGVNTVIDSFEDGDFRINVIDARDGDWFQAQSQAGLPLGTMTLEAGALHLTGGPTTLTPPEGQPDDWATFGVPLGQCYDASPYAGIRFRIKGNTSDGRNESIRFSISTPPTTGVSAGGSCPDGDLGCYNHFGSEVILESEWQTVTVTWAEMIQGNWGIMVPAGYDKAAHILAVNFAPLENTKGYDFTIDDVEFTSVGGGNCGDLVSESTFNSLFPSRSSFYTYAGFVSAAEKFPAFCGEGSEEDRKRDAAALFAHTIQETASNVTDPTTGLYHVEEIAMGAYCDAARTDFPCAGGQSYYGRGPLQLSWNYNYGTAGLALGLPLLAQPGLVAQTPETAFKAALWFWMTRQPLVSPHSLIVTGKGFGETIRLVNGPLECDGAAPEKTATRVAAFQHFCAQLGVEPGTSLDCQ